MRIITGKYRGRKIETVDSKDLRPTASRVRESMFNILSHGRFLNGEVPLLQGAMILDLFSGSGSLSVESLSRGAKGACMVDIDKVHLDLARKNVTHIGELENCFFLREDASKLRNARFEADVVFIDPPYESNLAIKTVQNLLNTGWVKAGSVIVVEMGKKEDFELPEGYELVTDRTYGLSRIRVLVVK